VTGAYLGAYTSPFLKVKNNVKKKMNHKLTGSNVKYFAISPLGTFLTRGCGSWCRSKRGKPQCRGTPLVQELKDTAIVLAYL